MTKEPVGGSDHGAVVEMGGGDDELVRSSAVRLGDGGPPAPAARPRALAAKVGDETEALAVPETPRLAQREWTRPDPLTRRPDRVCWWRPRVDDAWGGS